MRWHHLPTAGVGAFAEAYAFRPFALNPFPSREKVLGASEDSQARAQLFPTGTIRQNDSPSLKKNSTDRQGASK